MVGRLKKNRRGAAAVEVALVLPLLLLLTMGAIRYGWLFLKAQQITNAARAGARIAILPDVTINDDVLPAIADLMNAVGITGYNVSVILPDGVSWDALAPGEAVTVQVSVPCSNIDIMHVPLLTDLEPDEWDLVTAVTMAKEGPFTVIP